MRRKSIRPILRMEDRLVLLALAAETPKNAGEILVQANTLGAHTLVQYTIDRSLAAMIRRNLVEEVHSAPEPGRGSRLGGESRQYILTPEDVEVCRKLHELG